MAARMVVSVVERRRAQSPPFDDDVLYPKPVISDLIRDLERMPAIVAHAILDAGVKPGMTMGEDWAYRRWPVVPNRLFIQINPASGLDGSAYLRVCMRPAR